MAGLLQCALIDLQGAGHGLAVRNACQADDHGARGIHIHGAVHEGKDIGGRTDHRLAHARDIEKVRRPRQSRGIAAAAEAQPVAVRDDLGEGREGAQLARIGVDNVPGIARIWILGAHIQAEQHKARAGLDGGQALHEIGHALAGARHAHGVEPVRPAEIRTGHVRGADGARVRCRQTSRRGIGLYRARIGRARAGKAGGRRGIGLGRRGGPAGQRLDIIEKIPGRVLRLGTGGPKDRGTHRGSKHGARRVHDRPQLLTLHLRRPRRGRVDLTPA